MTHGAQDIARRLAEVKAKRGYLLPHHGLLALTADGLLEAYDRAYTALALEMKTLDAHDREFVWLAVLIATDEALATHHIAKFRAAGGNVGEIAAALRVAALARGAGAWRFVAARWSAHLADLDVDRDYREALGALTGATTTRLALMAALAAHAALGQYDLVRRVLPMAYAAGVPEPDLAEALSIMMFPGGVPHYVEAARVWMELIRAGAVTPSPAFAAWAALEGQGGFDEASGKSAPR